MSTQAKASWLFGTLFGLFILGVFMFGPAALPPYKQQLLAYICALLAGLFGLFFTGSLLLDATLPLAGKWTIQGGAGFALFLVVLFWWQSPGALIHAEKEPGPTTNQQSPAVPGTSDSSPDPKIKSPINPPKASTNAATSTNNMPAMVTTVETYTSDQVASGDCGNFGNWATLCSPDKPAGWTIVDQNFQLKGDRAGCAWAECQLAQPPTSTKVCYKFRMQGHSEECGHSGNTGIHNSYGELHVVWQHAADNRAVQGGNTGNTVLSQPSRQELSQRRTVIHLLRTTRGADVPTVVLNNAEVSVLQFELPAKTAGKQSFRARIIDVSTGKSVWAADATNVRSTVDGDYLATLPIPSLSSGEYMLSIDDTKQTVAQYPFVIENNGRP